MEVRLLWCIARPESLRDRLRTGGGNAARVRPRVIGHGRFAAATAKRLTALCISAPARSGGMAGLSREFSGRGMAKPVLDKLA